MRILLLGGTGVMGQYLASIYKNICGAEIYITTRKKYPSQKNIHYITGNAHDIKFLKSLQNPIWDILCDFMIYSEEELKERLDILLTMTNKYIFLSSARVYALTDDEITEKSARLIDTCPDKDYLQTNEYALEKAREENIFLNSFYNNWIIVRPYITYGDYRLQLGIYEKENWLYRILHGRTLIMTNDIADRITTLTSGKDVAKVIADITLNTTESGRNIYQIVSSETHSWKEICTTYCNIIQRITGNTIRVVYLPDISFMCDTYSKFQLKYDRLANRCFSSKKIESVSNVNWTKLENGLQKALENFISNPQWMELNWKSEALMDKAVGEFTPMHEMPNHRVLLKYFLYRYTPLAEFIIFLKQIKRKWKAEQ